MNQNMMGCEMELQHMLLAVYCQFGEDELIEWQHQVFAW
jgi:hypothetical protein